MNAAMIAFYEEETNNTIVSDVVNSLCTKTEGVSFCFSTNITVKTFTLQQGTCAESMYKQLLQDLNHFFTGNDIEFHVIYSLI